MASNAEPPGWIDLERISARLLRAEVVAVRELSKLKLTGRGSRLSTILFSACDTAFGLVTLGSGGEVGLPGEVLMLMRALMEKASTSAIWPFVVKRNIDAIVCMPPTEAWLV